MFFPGESHGQRSLAGCSPRGRKSQTRLSDSATTTKPQGSEFSKTTREVGAPDPARVGAGSLGCAWPALGGAGLAPTFTGGAWLFASEAWAGALHLRGPEKAPGGALTKEWSWGLLIAGPGPPGATAGYSLTRGPHPAGKQPQAGVFAAFNISFFPLRLQAESSQGPRPLHMPWHL